MSDVTRFIGDDGSRYEEPDYRFEYNGSLDDAQGNLGITYLMRDRESRKVVGIVKRFWENKLSAEKRREYRDAEADSLRRLNGANGHAPRLLATGVCSGPNFEDLPSILMERIDGETLSQALKKGSLTGGQSGSEQTKSRLHRLDAERTVRVARKIAEAIVACHAAGGEPPVVHRDLSLDNIMVSVRPDDGTVENAALIDFGQAVLETGTIVRLGTPVYSAPEIFGGKFFHESRNQRPWREQPTADVWSLGVIVYVMRTGIVPFNDEAFYDDVINVKNSYPQFMKANGLTLLKDLYPKGVADERSVTESYQMDLCLDAFVAICTAFDPNRRFQNAKEAHDALELILDNPRRALEQLNDLKELKGRAPKKNAKTVVAGEEPSPDIAPEPPRETNATQETKTAASTKSASRQEKASPQKKTSAREKPSVPMATPVSYSAASSPIASRPSAPSRSKSSSPKVEETKPTLLERIDPKLAWLWYLTIFAIAASWGTCFYFKLTPPVELWTFTVVATILGVPTCCWAWRAGRSLLGGDDEEATWIPFALTMVLLSGAGLSAHHDIFFLFSSLGDLPEWAGFVICLALIFFPLAVTGMINAMLGDEFEDKRPKVFYLPAALVIIAVSAALGLLSGPVVDTLVRWKVAQGVEATSFGRWSPEDRQTFTQDNLPSYATINSITDNPEWGDERIFSRIREAGTDDEFTNGIVVSPGKTYEVVILVINNASMESNMAGTGIARDVSVDVTCPDNVPGGALLTEIYSRITSSTTDPETVWSSIMLESYEPVEISYVPDSYELHGANIVDDIDVAEECLWGDQVEDDAHSLELHITDDELLGSEGFNRYISFQLEVTLPSS